MSESQPQQPRNIFLDSHLMRCPQVFEQYGPSIEGITRDLALWMAWNRAKQAQLNVKQFAEMFGYTRAFLMKRVSPEQQAWLTRKKFGPEFKDLIGYALAVMAIERLNFPDAAPFSAELPDGERRTYKLMPLIGDTVTTETTRRGTSYFFEISRSFLTNCEKRYKEFDLNEYLALKTSDGRAWSAGRKMFLHLGWKRSEWDRASAEDNHRHKGSKYDELLAVAGINRANEARTAHQLRQLLEDVGAFPRVAMSSEVGIDYSTGVYRVEFTKADRKPKAQKKSK